MSTPQVFISYSGHDAFEASLLQYAIESILHQYKVTAWTYERDQSRSERTIATALKKKMKQSVATIFLVSPSTLNGGAAQWIELGYADAFEVRTFVLLHHLDYNSLKTAEHGVPPLLLASHCTSALDWKKIVSDLHTMIAEANKL